MVKCKNCGKQNIKVRIINDGSKIITKKYICNDCNFIKTEKVDINMKRNITF